MTYTIRNNFHNSSVTIRAESLGHAPGEVTIRPSIGQLRKIRKALCGVAGCTCGGIRGPQSTPGGKRLIVDLSEEFAARCDR